MRSRPASANRLPRPRCGLPSTRRAVRPVCRSPQGGIAAGGSAAPGLAPSSSASAANSARARCAARAARAARAGVDPPQGPEPAAVARRRPARGGRRHLPGRVVVGARHRWPGRRHDRLHGAGRRRRGDRLTARTWARPPRRSRCCRGSRSARRRWVRAAPGWPASTASTDSSTGRVRSPWSPSLQRGHRRRRTHALAARRRRGAGPAARCRCSPSISPTARTTRSPSLRPDSPSPRSRALGAAPGLAARGQGAPGWRDARVVVAGGSGARLAGRRASAALAAAYDETGSLVPGTALLLILAVVAAGAVLVARPASPPVPPPA